MRFDDDDIPEFGGGPPPDPSMRQWRHPSEIAAAASAAARPDPPTPAERRQRTVLATTLVVAAVATVVVGFGAVIVATIGFPGPAVNLDSADGGPDAEAGLAGLPSIDSTLLRTTLPAATTSSTVLLTTTTTVEATTTTVAIDADAPQVVVNGLYVPERLDLDADAGAVAEPAVTAPSGRRLGDFVVIGDLILTSASLLSGHDDVHLVVDGVWTPVAVDGSDPVTDLALLEIIDGGDVVDLNALHREPLLATDGDTGMPAVGAAVFLNGTELTMEGPLLGPKGRVVNTTGDAIYGAWLVSIHPPSGSVGAAVTDADGFLVGLVVNSPSHYASLVSAETLVEVGTALQEWGLPAEEWIGAVTESADKGGVTVQVIDEGGPAATADIRVGDRVIRFNDQNVQDPHHLSHLIRELGAGTPVTIGIVRDGEQLERTLVIGLQPLSVGG